MFDFKDDLNLILKTLDLSIHDLANELHFDVPTISNWLNGKFIPDYRSKEDIYEYAFNNKAYINLAHEEAFKYLGKKEKFIPLYHGSKEGIKNELNLKYSKDNNDFGKGFYLGESLIQSSMFVCDYKDSVVYAFRLFDSGLKKYKFNIDQDWMLTIAYNRGLLNEYNDSTKLKKILNKSKDADYIIAPIANNRMFDIIKEFTSGVITDSACINALAALDLGNQYVLKTNKALKKLGLIKEFYLCKKEKQYYLDEKVKSQKDRSKNIKNFRSKYRDGKYIEELL